MFKRNFMYQRISYKHPLWANFPPNSLTTEEVKELVRNKEWEQLILKLGRSGLFIAGFYIQMGGNTDEIVSAAMLGLCAAIDKMKNNDFENINPRGYVTSYIHQYCFDTLENDTLIPVTRYARKRHNIKRIHTCPLIDTLDGTDDFDIIEFNEIMEKIVESELEREVLEHRRIGFEDDEIAVILCVSRSTISRIRSTLYERFVNYGSKTMGGRILQDFQDSA